MDDPFFFHVMRQLAFLEPDPEQTRFSAMLGSGNDLVQTISLPVDQLL